MANESFLLKKIRATQGAIDELIAGARSASVSTLGGSRSYTRESLPELRAYLLDLKRQFRMADMRKRVGPDFSTSRENY
jgi:hypothetical protein